MQGQWRGDVPPYITSNFLSYTRHTRGRGFDPRQCLKLIRNSNWPVLHLWHLQHCNAFKLWCYSWSFEHGHRVHCGRHQWHPQVKKSSAAVHTYQGLPPAVRRTRRWTLHYDAEMFNRLLLCNVIDCKCLVTKTIHKKRPGWPIFKKN